MYALRVGSFEHKEIELFLIVYFRDACSEELRDNYVYMHGI